MRLGARGVVLKTICHDLLVKSIHVFPPEKSGWITA